MVQRVENVEKIMLVQDETLFVLSMKCQTNKRLSIENSLSARKAGVVGTQRTCY